MTRSQFMDAFERALFNLPCKDGTYLSREERATALRYFEEYFDDAGIRQEDSVPTEFSNPDALAQQIVDEAEGGAPQENKQSEDTCLPFRSVHIDVCNAGIEFVKGDGYQVRIDYPEGIPAPRMEIREGQTLYIKELPMRRVFRFFSLRSWKNGMIRITVPQTAPEWFERFSVKTVNGAITLPALTLTELTCETVNGAIRLTGVAAEMLRAESVNGAISLAECRAQTKAHCETVNGSLALSGELLGNTHAETVNGSVRIEMQQPQTAYDLALETVSGSIFINGEKQRKKVRTCNKAANAVHAETVNGSIKLEFSK